MIHLIDSLQGAKRNNTESAVGFDAKHRTSISAAVSEHNWCPASIGSLEMRCVDLLATSGTKKTKSDSWSDLLASFSTGTQFLFLMSYISQNHRMVCVRKDLKNHPVPMPCHGQGHLLLGQVIQGLVQPGLICLIYKPGESWTQNWTQDQS